MYRNVRARILSATTEQKGIDLQACVASVHFVEWGEDAGDNVHIGFRAWDCVIHEGWVSRWSSSGVPVSLEAGDQKNVGRFSYSWTPHPYVDRDCWSDEYSDGDTHWRDSDERHSILPLWIWWILAPGPIQFFLELFHQHMDGEIQSQSVECAFVTENSEFTLINRTNNPLERFYRKMNDSFPTPHPTMTSFVGTIRMISIDNVTDLARITKGSMAKPVHLPVTVYPIPESYRSYMA